MENTTIPTVMNLASIAPFFTKSKDIVDEIAFSKVSTLDATKSVQSTNSRKDIGVLNSSCCIKLKVGFSIPLPAPTAPAIPKSRTVIKHPKPAYTDADFILLVFSAEKVLCQYPCEKTSAAVTATTTAKADLKLKVSNEFIPPSCEYAIRSLIEFWLNQIANKTLSKAIIPNP